VQLQQLQQQAKDGQPCNCHHHCLQQQCWDDNTSYTAEMTHPTFAFQLQETVPTSSQVVLPMGPVQQQVSDPAVGAAVCLPYGVALLLTPEALQQNEANVCC
jgi:hypothetical protein